MLILPIKKKWFDMILRKEKLEEYREIKPYWTTRFTNEAYKQLKLEKTINVFELFWTCRVIFKNGYKKDSLKIICECSIRKRRGQTRMGSREAEKNITY